MAKKLKGVWRQLTLTKDEKDKIETGSIVEAVDPDEGKSWLVACFGWVYGLPLNLMSMDVAEQLRKKIGNFIEVDSNPHRPGWWRNIHLRVKIDVIKPLRRFVTITRGRGISRNRFNANPMDAERSGLCNSHCGVSNNKKREDVIVIDGRKNDVSKESTEVSVEFVVDSLPFNDGAFVDYMDKGKCGNVCVLYKKVSSGVHVGFPLDSSQLVDIPMACSQETPVMRFISISIKRGCPESALKGKNVRKASTVKKAQCAYCDDDVAMNPHEAETSEDQPHRAMQIS
ncbi:hypothetical protein PTKIN_Ptkin05aG0116900 [Pterospermum kingtungense]